MYKMLNSSEAEGGCSEAVADGWDRPAACAHAMPVEPIMQLLSTETCGTVSDGPRMPAGTSPHCSSPCRASGWPAWGSGRSLFWQLHEHDHSGFLHATCNRCLILLTLSSCQQHDHDVLAGDHLHDYSAYKHNVARQDPVNNPMVERKPGPRAADLLFLPRPLQEWVAASASQLFTFVSNLTIMHCGKLELALPSPESKREREETFVSPLS